MVDFSFKHTADISETELMEAFREDVFNILLRDHSTFAALGKSRISRESYKYVPLQDFTSNSDIDWSKSVKENDQQLYKEYGLDEKEVEFVEKMIKGMERNGKRAGNKTK